MFKSLIFIATFVATALAQSATSQAMPAAATQGFDPGLVNNTRRLQWCTGQRNTCQEICGRTSVNNCDEQQLTYSCTCDNGTVPDCTAYMTTLPFYICEETYAQCLNNHPSTDPDGQAMCIMNHQCGNLTAQAATTATATSASSSGSATGSATSSATASSSSGNTAPSMMPLPTGAFAALLLGLCGLLL